MPGRAAVGLDIGTSGVRAAELSFGRSGTTLERFGQVALPPGAVRDGEVIDPDAVAFAIKQLWSQAKFSTKRVALGVGNQKVVVRQVDLPWLPTDELRGSLAFQVADIIPMPVEEALLDFHPLEEFIADNGARMLRVLLVAASRDMVNASIDAVTRAGLKPVSIDLTPFAVLRSLAPPDELGLADADAEALVDIGASITNIVIHQGGVPRFVRILLMGGSDITDAVGQQLGVPYEHAEALKQQCDPSAGAVVDSCATTFVEEVSGSLDYYLAQAGAARLGRLVLAGGGARLSGLSARLAVATRLPVHPGSPMPRMKVGKTGLTAEQLAYVEPLASVPVGLALGRAS